MITWLYQDLRETNWIEPAYRAQQTGIAISIDLLSASSEAATEGAWDECSGLTYAPVY